MARVGILGFLHESNTFLGVSTTWTDFESTSMTCGPALRKRWEGSHHELGGFFSGSETAGLTAVPLMATYAVPSGVITAETYERIAAQLLQNVRDAGPLDGLLVALHGATVSAEYPDADGEFLRRLQNQVGSTLPLVVTLDLHANVSRAMVEHSTALIAYRSNPHLDQQQRGHEAALLMGRILAGQAQPCQALAAPPFVIAISQQYTSVEPARTLYQDLEQVLTWPGILSASVTMGFYYADTEEMGAGFLAVADNNLPLAQRAVDWMSRRAWERRHDFVGKLPASITAVADALRSKRKPVVLMDVGDNVGAGSPADSTVLLQEILRQGGKNSLVVLFDPQSVETCVRAGVRSEVHLQVGGKTDDRHGKPVPIRGIVRTLSDGRYHEPQVRHGGWGESDQGVSAVVETAENNTVILTSRRMAPMSLEQIVSVGVHAERKDIVVVKGAVAPRAAYEPIAGEVVMVDTPGVTAGNPLHFSYKHRRKPLFPFEPETTYK